VGCPAWREEEGLAPLSWFFHPAQVFTKLDNISRYC
jgi:hypothetical protein